MTEQRRETDEQGHQLANLPEADPGNTDPHELTQPLDANDDVFTLLDQQNRGEHQ